MKTVTREIFSTFIPVAALIVSRKKLNIPGSYDNSCEYALESRAIREDGTLGAATPVKKSFIQDLASRFASENFSMPFGPMPENVIYADFRPGNMKYVWFTPPGKRMRYFIESLGIEEGEYFVPGCIYIASENSLRVYAFDGQRPTERTKILQGPFFNDYGDHICLGNAKSKKTKDTWKHLQEYWEDLFWNSRDSHLGANRPTKENLVLTIKKYKDIPFDCSELNPAGMTLKKLISNED